MPDSATMVRAHQGDTLITDGPFAETKEFLGGFWVIEAPDLDAALAWAEKASAACRGPGGGPAVPGRARGLSPACRPTNASSSASSVRSAVGSSPP